MSHPVRRRSPKSTRNRAVPQLIDESAVILVQILTGHYTANV